MATILSDVDLMRRIPLLASLTPQQTESLSQSLLKLEFKKGESIIQQGSRPDFVFIVLSGRVRVVSTHKKGREVFLAKLTHGDIFGEVDPNTNQPSSATVHAEIHTHVLALRRPSFMHCLNDNSRLACAVLNRMTQRLRQAEQRVESLSLLDVHGRVARTLVESAAMADDGAMIIREKVSRQDIAKMVGASREMVSRVMKDLEKRGCFHVDDQSRMTLNKELLNQLH